MKQAIAAKVLFALLLLALLLPAAAQVDAAASQTAPTPLYHPPAAPLYLSAGYVSGYTIDLTWSSYSGNVNIFIVEASVDGGITFNQFGVPLPSSARGVRSYVYKPNTEYMVRVVAIAPATVGLYRVPSTPIKVTTNQEARPSSDSRFPIGGGPEILTSGDGLIGEIGTFSGGDFKTPDNKLILSFPSRIVVRDQTGSPPSDMGQIKFKLSASPLTNPPPAPSSAAIIRAFELRPGAVIFMPDIYLKMPYTDADLPQGMPEGALYIGVWDGTQWVKLTSVLDTAYNIVTAQIAHLGSYALLASAQPPEVTAQFLHPPVAPTIISASAVNGYQAMVRWVDNSDNETVFRIERENGPGSWHQVGLLAGANETMGLAYPLSPNSEQTLRVVAIAPVRIGLYESPSAPVKVTTNNSEIISNPPDGPIGGGEIRLRCVGFNHDLGISTAGTLLDVDPEIKSLDGVLMLSFPRFINVRQEGIGVLSTISVSSVATTMPAPPQGGLIAAYEFGPVGISFVPGSAATEGYPNTHVTLTMSYTDAQIPAGMSETSFYIAIWDGAQWVKLPTSALYATFNTVTARIAHTGTYALLAEAQPPATTQPPPTTTLQPTNTDPTQPPTTTMLPFSRQAPPTGLEQLPWLLIFPLVLIGGFTMVFHFRQRGRNAGKHGEKDA